MRVTFLLLACLWTGSILAEPAPEPGDETTVQDDQDTSDVNDAGEEIPDLDAGSLRTRELSDAFENFQPSEEISVDNAVTFPVDI